MVYFITYRIGQWFESAAFSTTSFLNKILLHLQLWTCGLKGVVPWAGAWPLCTPWSLSPPRPHCTLQPYKSDFWRVIKGKAQLLQTALFKNFWNAAYPTKFIVCMNVSFYWGKPCFCRKRNSYDEPVIISN